MCFSLCGACSICTKILKITCGIVVKYQDNLIEVCSFSYFMAFSYRYLPLSWALMSIAKKKRIRIFDAPTITIKSTSNRKSSRRLIFLNVFFLLDIINIFKSTILLKMHFSIFAPNWKVETIHTRNISLPEMALVVFSYLHLPHLPQSYNIS